MTKRRTTGEQISDIDKKMQQLTAQKRMLESRKKVEDRKARTKRLIHIGAEVESVLGKPIEDEDLSKLKKFLLDQEARGKYFSRAMEVTDKEEVDKGEADA